MVIDLRHINKASSRIGMPFSSSADIFRELPAKATCLLVLDLLQSFFQLRVDPADQHLLAFICPAGKFRLKRCPMGQCNSQDSLQVHSRCLLIGLEHCLKIFDNILLYANDLTDLYRKGSRLLWNAVAKNWKFSLPKIQCSTKLEYCGYMLQVSPTGTVSTFPSTNCITDLIEIGRAHV